MLSYGGQKFVISPNNGVSGVVISGTLVLPKVSQNITSDE